MAFNLGKTMVNKTSVKCLSRDCHNSSVRWRMYLSIIAARKPIRWGSNAAHTAFHLAKSWTLGFLSYKLRLATALCYKLHCSWAIGPCMRSSATADGEGVIIWPRRGCGISRITDNSKRTNRHCKPASRIDFAILMLMPATTGHVPATSQACAYNATLKLTSGKYGYLLGVFAHEGRFLLAGNARGLLWKVVGYSHLAWISFKSAYPHFRLLLAKSQLGMNRRDTQPGEALAVVKQRIMTSEMPISVYRMRATCPGLALTVMII